MMALIAATAGKNTTIMTLCRWREIHRQTDEKTDL